MKKTGTQLILHTALFAAVFLYDEFLLRLFSGGSLFHSAWYILAAAVSAGLFAVVLTSFGKVSFMRIVRGALLLLSAVWFITQTLLNRVYAMYLPLASIRTGAGGVASQYTDMLLRTILLGIPVILLYLIPLFLYVAACVYNKKHPSLIVSSVSGPARAVLSCALLLCALALHFVTAHAEMTGRDADLYASAYTFDNATRAFGLLTSTRLDLKYRIFGTDEDDAFDLDAEFSYTSFSDTYTYAAAPDPEMTGSYARSASENSGSSVDFVSETSDVSVSSEPEVSDTQSGSVSISPDNPAGSVSGTYDTSERSAFVSSNTPDRTVSETAGTTDHTLSEGADASDRSTDEGSGTSGALRSGPRVLAGKAPASGRTAASGFSRSGPLIVAQKTPSPERTDVSDSSVSEGAGASCASRSGPLVLAAKSPTPVPAGHDILADRGKQAAAAGVPAAPGHDTPGKPRPEKSADPASDISEESEQAVSAESEQDISSEAEQDISSESEQDISAESEQDISAEYESESDTAETITFEISRKPMPPQPNAMDLDFAKLQAESSGAASAISEYVSTLTPSMKNRYTGIFRGKNLILICAEAYNDSFVSRELTPTLWRLSHNGFWFSDFYQPAWGGSTSTGEFSMVFGLAPQNSSNTILQTQNSNNYFTMGNQLQRLGYHSWAFHNGTNTYYNRNLTHQNLGYDEWIAMGSGLEEMSGGKYLTDEEMFDATMDLYLDQQPFSVYYMTINGHAPYSNPNDSKVTSHIDRVKEVLGEHYKDFSQNTINYICYQMVLEDALTLMIRRLDEAGILDDTVIAMTGDHYPYGLRGSEWGNSTDNIENLVGHEASTPWGLDKTGCIIWSGCLENACSDFAVEIDTPSYSLDMLPTLSNLFGLEYDSRLLIGRDVFSDEMPLVLWNNGSWITARGRYNARTGIYEPAESYRNTEETPKSPAAAAAAVDSKAAAADEFPDLGSLPVLKPPSGADPASYGPEDETEYQDWVRSVVKNKLAFSKQVIDNNYYEALFGKDETGKKE